MSRKDELIREAAAEIDRINKVLDRVEYRGYVVPFGIDDALALVKRLLAEASDAEGRNGEKPDTPDVVNKHFIELANRWEALDAGDMGPLLFVQLSDDDVVKFRNALARYDGNDPRAAMFRRELDAVFEDRFGEGGSNRALMFYEKLVMQADKIFGDDDSELREVLQRHLSDIRGEIGRKGTKGITEREAEAGELAPAEPAAGEPLPWLLALSKVLEEMRDEER